MAVAMEMASQIISIALMMSLPAGAGFWADLKLGTGPWLVVVGAVLGLLAGMTQLVRWTGGTKRTKYEKRNSDQTPH